MKRRSTLSIFRNKKEKKKLSLEHLENELEYEEALTIYVAHSFSYIVIFWIKWLLGLFFLGSLLFFIPKITVKEIIFTIFLFLFLLFILYIYKKRVLDRNRICFSGSTVTIQRGRWFILDDDMLFSNAIDYIRIDRSVMGYILGWCSLEIITRNGSFAFKHMDLKSSELLRANIIH